MASEQQKRQAPRRYHREYHHEEDDHGGYYGRDSHRREEVYDRDHPRERHWRTDRGLEQPRVVLNTTVPKDARDALPPIATGLETTKLIGVTRRFLHVTCMLITL